MMESIPSCTCLASLPSSWRFKSVESEAKGRKNPGEGHGDAVRGGGGGDDTQARALVTFGGFQAGVK